jgi:copper homeostasis protein
MPTSAISTLEKYGKWLPSPMRYRNTGLSMSTDAEADEYSRYGVDGESVAEMKAIIERFRR